MATDVNLEVESLCCALTQGPLGLEGAQVLTSSPPVE